MNEIVPFLWFEGCADEAVALYRSVFGEDEQPEALIAPEAGPWKAGQVVTLTFVVKGLRMIAFNGGAHDHAFNNAISFSVPCDTQAEIDRYWDGLLAGGGEPIACGWLKDRFGVRWQIVPRHIGSLIGKPAAMKAMMDMMKLDIGELERAAAEDTPA